MHQRLALDIMSKVRVSLHYCLFHADLLSLSDLSRKRARTLHLKINLTKLSRAKIHSMKVIQCPLLKFFVNERQASKSEW